MSQAYANGLVEVCRGELVESCHTGAIAVVGSDGELLYAVGDVERPVYARSALKPFQAISFIESGAYEHFGFAPKHLAIACGSHNGERQHTETADEMLSRIGLADEHLHCHGHPPYHVESYEDIIRTGGTFRHVHNNCSGKHAAMLAQCVHRKYTVDDYHLITHPLQQEVLHTLAELTDVPAEQIHVGIDGCGLPTHALPLQRIALAYARLADPGGLADKRQNTLNVIAAAMTSHPEMVGGTGAFCTDLMTAMQGSVVGKIGAEGFYGLSLRERSIGVAIKVFDGSERGLYPAVVEVLDQLGVLSAEQKAALADYHHPKNRNRQNLDVGDIRPVFSLQKQGGEA